MMGRDRWLRIGIPRHAELEDEGNLSTFSSIINCDNLDSSGRDHSRWTQSEE
jgi:hypothetical protein